MIIFAKRINKFGHCGGYCATKMFKKQFIKCFRVQRVPLYSVRRNEVVEILGTNRKVLYSES